ncbi:MAG: secondary metabolism, biosynthesis of secondary products derived from primary amino acid [Verrucomicrobiales bacterium]|nr:secondary metabolism, biosynthesis of secondary products derived from primary amino acid [Verrucomicrobiales bacterium]
MRLFIACSVAFSLLFSPPCDAADQPQWGQAWTRNMVSPEKGVPSGFDPQTKAHIKWVAALGTQSYSTPTISKGKVFIGTNNDDPRDPTNIGDRGVLMCLDDETGELLWQLVVPKRTEDPFHDWPKTGMSSPATVEGNSVYMVDNRGVLLSLDINGQQNGNQGPFMDEGTYFSEDKSHPREIGKRDADILWACDLTKEAGIWSHDGAHSSVMIDGNYLYLNSGTGVDNTHKVIRTPEAPSLVVVDKRTGRLVAQDNEKFATNIFHCTWSSPSMAELAGFRTVVFCGGNGVIYGFEPIRESSSLSRDFLKKRWEFDFDPTAPKEDIHKYSGNKRESPSNIFGMPVVQGDKIYVAGGGDLWWGKNVAWLKCISIPKTPTGKPQLLWSYPLEKHVMATPAIYEGMIFIPDCGRKMHCIDQSTGKVIWTHDITGEAWASALVCDKKVYVGTRSGEFLVFAASRTKQLLATLQLGNPINATPTVANGTLYVGTMKELFAIRK